MALLDGVQDHIDAVANGETIAARLDLIAASNHLSDDAKRVQGYFVKAWCWQEAIDPLCGSTVLLGNGLALRLNRHRSQIEGNELPGVRVDHDGWLVIEGDFLLFGAPLPRLSRVNDPLWPLMLRNVPARGAGPYENFRPQVLDALTHIGWGWSAPDVRLVV